MEKITSVDWGGQSYSDDYLDHCLVLDPSQIKMEDAEGHPYIKSEKIAESGSQFTLRYSLTEYAPDWLREWWTKMNRPL